MEIKLKYSKRHLKLIWKVILHQSGKSGIQYWFWLRYKEPILISANPPQTYAHNRTYIRQVDSYGKVGY